MSSDKCIVTIIDSLQDYLRYKESCKRREREIKEYKQSDQHEDNGLLMVAEAEFDDYPRIHNRENSIPIIDIIEYIEDFDPTMIDDLQAIQLMLYKIAGWRCNAEEYKRIGEADKKVMRKAKQGSRKVIVRKGGQYNEKVNKMKNNYGRRKNN